MSAGARDGRSSDRSRAGVRAGVTNRRACAWRPASPGGSPCRTARRPGLRGGRPSGRSRRSASCRGRRRRPGRGRPPARCDLDGGVRRRGRQQRRRSRTVGGDGAASERQRDIPVAPSSDTSSAWLPSRELETQRRLPRGVPSIMTAAPAGTIRPTASASAPPPPCCASTAPDRRREPAAIHAAPERGVRAGRRLRRRCRNRYVAGDGSRDAGNAIGADATDGALVDGTTRGPKARGGAAREIGAGSAGASVAAGCGPRDGTARKRRGRTARPGRRVPPSLARDGCRPACSGGRSSRRRRG